MSIEKMIFGKGDTFLTMHEKLKELIGKDVQISPCGSRKIFDVTDIKQDFFINMIPSFCEFIDGDMGYATHGGDFNFKATDSQLIPIWSFAVSYGFEKGDMKAYSDYKFSIPRSGVLIEDGKQICKMNNCPFISYEL